ncbi:hypothetical protein DEVEQU_03733 [Devosia equisanguinis]|uniref:DUF945 domain-containing protein n=1 Tax=Devosia equisanguinis TaxID=2490941 RepID=A0A3S4CV61_9HYPH|nr:hypothetical protein [Devosia equisanguinis]VDS06569.1 hypothetical protein DEVEQU_03733 [Devosia equisanguinis]
MNMRNLLISIAATALLAVPVQAAPIDDFFARANQYLAELDGSLSYAIGPGYDANTTGLQPLVLTSPDGTAVTLGEKAYVSSVTTLPGDLLYAQGLHISNFDRTQDGTRVRIGGLIADVLLPPLGMTDPMLLAQGISGLSLFDFTLESSGVTVSFDSASYFLNVLPERGSADPSTYEASVALEGFLVTEALLEQVDAPQVLAPLIGRKVDLDIRFNWRRDAGAIDPFSVEIGSPDFGDLAFSVGLNGITQELLAALVEMGQQRATGSDGAALQAKLIPLFSQVTVSALFSGLFNEGGAAILLEQMAQETGQSSTKTIQSASTGLRDMLLANGLDTLALPAGDALSAALSDGGGVIISGYPATPPSVLELIALQTPKAIAERLELQAKYDEPSR